jgi:hypothetical protein
MIDQCNHYAPWQVRGELESMGCQIKMNCEVKSVSSLEGGGTVHCCTVL